LFEQSSELLNREPKISQREWGARRVRLVLATPKPKLRDSGNAFGNAPDMLSVLSQRVHVRFPFVGRSSASLRPPGIETSGSGV
jgi:hypothetical protein